MIVQLSPIKRNCESMGKFKTPVGFIVVSLELLEQHFWNLSVICSEEACQFACNNFKRNLGFRFFADTYMRVLRKDAS